MEIDFLKIEHDILCGTLGCPKQVKYVCWTSWTNEPDTFEHLTIIRPLVICEACLKELRRIGGT